MVEKAVDVFNGQYFITHNKHMHLLDYIGRGSICVDSPRVMVLTLYGSYHTQKK